MLTYSSLSLPEVAHPTLGACSSRGLPQALLSAICPLSWDDPVTVLWLLPQASVLHWTVPFPGSHVFLLPGHLSYAPTSSEKTRQADSWELCMLSGRKLAMKGHSAVLWCLPFSFPSSYVACPHPNLLGPSLSPQLESFLLMSASAEPGGPSPSYLWGGGQLQVCWGSFHLFLQSCPPRAHPTASAPVVLAPYSLGGPWHTWAIGGTPR